jgi:hypothetical protein
MLHPLLEIVHVVMQQLSASLVRADEKVPCAFLRHVTVGAVGARSRIDTVELFASGAKVGGLFRKPDLVHLRFGVKHEV